MGEKKQRVPIVKIKKKKVLQAKHLFFCFVLQARKVARRMVWPLKESIYIKTTKLIKQDCEREGDE